MKNISKYISFAIILFFIGSVVGLAQAATTPEQATKSFYEWYVQELSREGGNPIRNKQTVLKSVSKRLGKFIYSPAYHEYGADYIIDAQDFDDSWQVSTTKAVIKGNRASLKVLLK